MNRKTQAVPICFLISLVGLFALVAASQAAVPSDAHQWEVHNADGVSSGIDYELYNQKNKKQIGYKKRTDYGHRVDLDWVGHSGGHFQFMHKAPDGTRDHRRRPIPENADVAVYNTKARRYLKYKKHDNTVTELEWSQTPAYEWQIHDQKGTSVASFALLNIRAKKYLVLQTKDYGINLGWLSDSPPPSPGPATSAVSFKMFASGAPKCTADLRWEWEPVQLTGTTGTTAKVTQPSSGFHSYDVQSRTEGATTVCYMIGDNFTSFATGMWRIRLVGQVTGTLAQCQVTLKTGLNFAGFRSGVATCKETPPGSFSFQYP